MAFLKDILDLLRGNGTPACCAVSIEALPEPAEPDVPAVDAEAPRQPTPEGAPGDA
ncbi:MAG TPA: hypothetical protein VD995_00610 [Azospirillum sp.]|nr:hypothetical protein [Azospirillum sp.]